MNVFSLESLLARTTQGDSFKYLYFWGHHPEKNGQIGKSCFSQWFPASFEENTVQFATGEHYMMWRKAKLFNDAHAAEKIVLSQDPGKVKAIGRTIQGFDEQLWQQERFQIVQQGNWLKFSQNPALKAFLLETGEQILVEASPVDPIWGVGLAQDDPLLLEPATWQGLNLLGFALMLVRKQLVNETSLV